MRWLPLSLSISCFEDDGGAAVDHGDAAADTDTEADTDTDPDTDTDVDTGGSGADVHGDG